ncbi:LytTR family DNA-binding domain-containing protein [Spirosoma validum]|uniref:LytTR family transcriptional regulator n=1 Tax=Spirosoma validum TaxID=2771355 RepID=A0A927B6E4_9BACT|nr:LytTR family DNA-binding domain-containing protein [Spirosoma validum]MBD2756123.1 LytTR family transcriptional regulator [Spirosoma validum]
MATQFVAKTRIVVPAYRHIQDTKLIIRLEGRGNYSLVYVRDTSNPLMVSRTLKYFEDQFADFIRVNKSSLINPNYIDRVIRKDAKTVAFLLIDGMTILASRRRVADTLARLAN